MSEVLQTNIFFFVTGIAVIIITALLVVALYHGIKVLKSFRKIVDRIEAGTEEIAEDIQNVREYFTEGGFLLRILGNIMGTRGNGGTKKSSRSDKKRTELKIKDEV